MVLKLVAGSDVMQFRQKCLFMGLALLKIRPLSYSSLALELRIITLMLDVNFLAVAKKTSMKSEYFVKAFEEWVKSL